MSNPTTPFSWQMPTNTDLVTDLPADFEVFGQAVATSMQDLLGGTTGQVLAKASNADMDFVWSADAAGMTNPMTTTGDIIYSSPGSTPVRRAIGSTGNVLTVAGGIPTWAAPSGGLTLISNTTFSAVSSYSLPANTFSATYTNYKAIIDISSFSASGTFFTRLRASGTDTSTNYVNTRIYGTGTGIASDSPSSTAYFLGDVDTNTNYTAEMTLFKPNVAIKKWHISKYFAYNGTWDTGQVGGRLDNATQYDSLTLIPSSGTISGRIFVYGYAI